MLVQIFHILAKCSRMYQGKHFGAVWRRWCSNLTVIRNWKKIYDKEKNLPFFNNQRVQNMVKCNFLTFENSYKLFHGNKLIESGTSQQHMYRTAGVYSIYEATFLMNPKIQGSKYDTKTSKVQCLAVFISGIKYAKAVHFK